MLQTLSSGTEKPAAERECAPDGAIAACLKAMRTRVGGCGGVICISPRGDVGIGFTTERMAWAVRGGLYDGVRAGVDRRVHVGTDAVELVDLTGS